jgi:hypothetical protein
VHPRVGECEGACPTKIKARLRHAGPVSKPPPCGYAHKPLMELKNCGAHLPPVASEFLVSFFMGDPAARLHSPLFPSATSPCPFVVPWAAGGLLRSGPSGLCVCVVRGGGGGGWCSHWPLAWSRAARANPGRCGGRPWGLDWNESNTRVLLTTGDISTHCSAPASRCIILGSYENDHISHPPQYLRSQFKDECPRFIQISVQGVPLLYSPVDHRVQLSGIPCKRDSRHH